MLNRRWDDTAYLKNSQYRDSRNLGARANLHAKYGRGDWFDWVLRQHAWTGHERVLELGCGAGWLWESRSGAPSVQLELTDLSDGMMIEAVNRARGAGWDAAGQAVDATCLPYPDETFDLVVANHMLYHLPVPSIGVSEIHRVLKLDGVALVATNGLGNMAELFAIMARVFGQAEDAGGIARFSRETGEPILNSRFHQAEWRAFEDTLVCRDPVDVLNYLTSSPPADQASAPQLAQLEQETFAAFARAGGNLVIHKDVGLFHCRKSAAS